MHGDLKYFRNSNGIVYPGQSRSVARENYVHKITWNMGRLALIGIIYDTQRIDPNLPYSSYMSFLTCVEI